jgi:hypothetical protein
MDYTVVGINYYLRLGGGVGWQGDGVYQEQA